MTISSATQVIVGARISKSGNAMPQPGDLAGESAAGRAGRERASRSRSAASSAKP